MATISLLHYVSILNQTIKHEKSRRKPTKMPNCVRWKHLRCNETMIKHSSNNNSREEGYKIIEYLQSSHSKICMHSNSDFIFQTHIFVYLFGRYRSGALDIKNKNPMPFDKNILKKP